MNQAPVGNGTQVHMHGLARASGRYTLECVQDAGAPTQGQICSYVSLKASSLLHRHVATMAQAGPGLPQLIMFEIHLRLAS